MVITKTCPDCGVEIKGKGDTESEALEHLNREASIHEEQCAKSRLRSEDDYSLE